MPGRAALRFDHPDFAAGTPGLVLAPTGGLALVDGHRAVRQAILLLLSTRPGERVRRPDYGCDLASLVFAPNDETTAGLAIHLVRRAIERFEPGVEIVRLDARAALPGDPARLVIELDYRVRASGAADRLRLALDLGQG